MTAYIVLATDLIDPIEEAKAKVFRNGPADWCVCTGAGAKAEARHRAARYRRYYKHVYIRPVGTPVEV